jgi:hypothetical protein
MKVWVCRRRDNGEIVDVLEQSVHPKLFPDTLRTFRCLDEEWSVDALKAFRTPPMDLKQIEDAILQAELQARGFTVTKKAGAL